MTILKYGNESTVFLIDKNEYIEKNKVQFRPNQKQVQPRKLLNNQLIINFVEHVIY